MKVIEFDMSLRRPSGRTSFHPSRGHGSWVDGSVFTPHGIVTVYAQGGPDSTPHTRLEFIRDCRLYVRSFDGKRYSTRGLVTQANLFAKEVCERLS